MPATAEAIDPWDPSGLPFSRLWPVFAGVGGGVVVALVWFAVGRPDISYTSFLVMIGAIAGAIGAGLAPAGRRTSRFLDVAYPFLVAGVAARFFSAIGLILTGNDDGTAGNTVFVYFFVMLFFVGFPVLIARVFQNPSRRLPEAVLAQIGEPYPTSREPRLVTIRAEDGTTHRISVLRGGFVAGMKVPFEIAAVTGVAKEGQVPTGPKGKPAAGSRGRRTTSTKDSSPASPRVEAEASYFAKRQAKAAAKAAKAAGEDDDAGEPSRPTPAPSSRTTPKGTQGNRKRSKR